MCVCGAYVFMVRMFVWCTCVYGACLYGVHVCMMHVCGAHVCMMHVCMVWCPCVYGMCTHVYKACMFGMHVCMVCSYLSLCVWNSEQVLSHLYVGSEDSNSSCQACPESTVTTEPSP